MQIAWYMFINHGRFPREVAALSEQERLLLYVMIEKEIRNRPKQR